MSESRITYIPCASGHNVFTDCMVQQYGDLIRRYGHAQMDFTAADAKTMAYHIHDRVRRKMGPSQIRPRSRLINTNGQQPSAGDR